MSAYALSGSLFPPIASFSTSSRCTSSKTEPFAENQCQNDPPDAAVIALPENDVSGGIEVGIAVKSARIDPVRLVQPLPGRGKLLQRGRMADTCKPPRPIQGRVVDSSSIEEPDMASDPALCSEHDELGNEEHNDMMTAPSSSTTSCDISTPHRDAIQFELSISLNGRKYSATRTLPRIIELRNELIRELNIRRKGSRLRRMRWRNQPEKLDKDDDTVETVDEYSEFDQECGVTIPELPECIADGTESVATGGFGSRGFRMVQALLHSYCPAVERWLRHVADVVPPNSSPCLTNFLWEPLSKNWSSQNTNGQRPSNLVTSRVHESFSTLDSIDETNDIIADEDDYGSECGDAENVASR